jgi:hypothetical protein
VSIVLDAILRSAINPALTLLPPKMDSDAARVMMLAIGLQESRLSFRFQKTSDPYTKGPARGLWEMERAGGVAGVMSHVKTHPDALVLCQARKVPFDSALIHARLEFDDILAAGFARLLLWADSKPMPDVDASHDESWDCYVRNWRPGKPRRETWDEYHAAARAQVIA